MRTTPFCTLRLHLHHSLACSLLLLSALVPAHAQLLPGTIEPLSYGTTIDLAAQTATFAIRFDRAFDFVTLDEVGRQADQFAVWTDTVSTNPQRSTRDGLIGRGPLGTQMVVINGTDSSVNQLSYAWPQLLTDADPTDPLGWAVVKGSASYVLDSDNTLSFIVPLALLHAADGHFNYSIETFLFGRWGALEYFGTSGQEYGLCVPEPAHAAMLGAGLLLLTGARQLRRKQM